MEISNSEAVKPKENLGVLNFLKCVLTILIFLFHWNIHFNINFNYPSIDNLIHIGGLWISGFIIISGFLLYFVHSEDKFSDWNILKSFYIKRLSKILPIYFLVLFITDFLLKNGQNYEMSTPKLIVAYILEIIPLQSLFPALFVYLSNDILWFVSAIICLYMIFPYLCQIIRSVKINPFVLFVILYLIGIIPTFVSQWYYPIYFRIDYYVNPLYRIPEFLLGMLTAKYYLQNKDKNDKNAFISFFIAITLFLGIDAERRFLDIDHVNLWADYNVVTMLLIPILVYFLVKSKGKFIEFIANNTLINYFSKLSYAFYVTQAVVICLCKRYMIPASWYGYGTYQILITSFIINLIFAVIAYEFIGKIFRKT